MLSVASADTETAEEEEAGAGLAAAPELETGVDETSELGAGLDSELAAEEALASEHGSVTVMVTPRLTVV
ncbi:hypothetical protein OGAPHI_006043 [Ogataea philodendri]|uniref:Uncharacterized protein n=1 Tax=Ogataea philodendri TaxID=1378263 RepID=A0A9P8T170_9ASCO|nr:uncharacterized protein OGAPHI_006043 [Ogataea philodendri]KAH3661864.1 hypothetical protein OGAPHI_006043 [Ogataea philodendri]